MIYAFIIVGVLVTCTCVFIQGWENTRPLDDEYWEKLAAFLDRRDEIIIHRLRDNQDHKIKK